MPLSDSQSHHEMLRPVQILLDVFAGIRPLQEIERVMSERVVHKNFLITQDGQKHFEEKQGIQEWKTWAIILRKSVANLGVDVEDMFVRDNQVFAVFRWVADKWHSSIAGNPRHSNFVYAKYTLEQGKITVTETCRQNYIFMFGTDFSPAHLSRSYKALLGFPVENKPAAQVISGWVDIQTQPGRLTPLLQDVIGKLTGESGTESKTQVFLAGPDKPTLPNDSVGGRPVTFCGGGQSGIIAALVRAVKALDSGLCGHAVVAAFDAAGSSSTSGVHLGAVLVEDMSQALAENRTIHGIIRGAAVAKADVAKRGAVHHKILSALYSNKQITPDTIGSVQCLAPAGDTQVLAAAYGAAFKDSAEPQLLSVQPSFGAVTSGFAGLLQALRSLKGHAGTRVALDAVADEGIGHVILDGHKSSEVKRVEVAVIGMAGVMPGSDNPDDFWRNLVEQKDLLSDISKTRGLIDWADGEAGVRYAGLLGDVDAFDAMFFNISPKEAELMDPQQRLIMQVVWQAVEHSANPLSSFANERTAVFMGSCNQDYKQLFHDSGGQIHSLNYTGLEGSMLANRVARLLNCAGPCQTMNMECASTLVALHNAMDLIQNGEVDRAVVGAVNVLLHPYGFEVRDKNGLLCSGRKALPFDQDSQGYIRGEGAGAFVLKRLDQAQADKDNILAVLKGSAVNQSRNALSLTAPHAASQTRVVLDAWDAAGVDPSTITYVETHANGFVEGDVVEVNVLKKAFREAYGRWGITSNEKTCGITSVKSAIGHLEAASGVSMLMRVILSLQHGQMLAVQGLGTLNSRIDLSDAPFSVCRENRKWEQLRNDLGELIPRRAGINSFGVGGTNAHVLVEEYLAEPAQTPAADGPDLIVLSAKTQERLQQVARNLVEFLQRQTQEAPISLQQLAYTLQIGRQAMPERLALVVSSVSELMTHLHDFLQGNSGSDNIFQGRAKKTGGDAAAVRLALQNGAPAELAAQWVEGASIDWSKLHKGVVLQKLALPTYPFVRKAYWLPDSQPLAASVVPDYENKAVEFYSFWAQESGSDYQEEYLTFCPFPEKIPGFSVTRIFLNPGKYPDEMDFVREKQIEMREVLFYKEDYERIRTFLDFGCGHGTDVIQFAKRYPQIRTHGFTITGEQARLGNSRIAQNDLGDRAKIFHKNSAEDVFPGAYDLVIGVEVSFHIRNKDGLFGNISAALNPGGRVLLMDFVANLRGAIVDPKVEISIPTQAEWVALLSRHDLIIDEFIDVSPQVANFLYDPDLEQNIKGRPQVVRDTYTNYVHQSLALSRNWISYCLIKLEKNAAMSYSERCEWNLRKLQNPIPYPEALEEMLHPETYAATVREVSAPVVETVQPAEVSAYASVGDVRKALQVVFAEVLKFDVEDIEAAATFEELGVTSITAVELLEGINHRFNLNLPTSIVFEFNTLTALAESVFAVLPKRRPAAKPVMAPTPVLATQPTEPTHEAAQRSDDIAVIGLSCRCAGAADQAEFWDLVSTGKDCIGSITNPDWLDFFRDNSSKPVPLRYGQMADIEYFDPLFFNMSPKEAAAIDPSHRMVLEEGYRALEDAGYAPGSLKGRRVGVYLGSMGSISADTDDSHFAMLGSETSILSARLAYFLDLKGPALAVNTACSSSLVAMDLACRQLKGGDINLAVAGGVTIYQSPDTFVRMNNAGMLSPTGQCRPFDKAADGVVVGDGIGMVILKRLRDAETDGDRIYGIIRGHATNQDGQTSGITVPSFMSQSRLEQAVYSENGISVEDIQYIETHGTATKLGDPIEIHALQDSFGKFTDRKGYCAIGSLKGNIGHTTAASGVLSVIKVLLSFQNGKLAPSLHYTEGNEHISFTQSPFYVNTALKDWPLNARGTRMAAVSSFGFSGTNAHMVLEAPQRGQAAAIEDGPAVITLSAQSPEALRTYAERLHRFVVDQPVGIAQLAYTLQVGRDEMEYRFGAVVGNRDDLISGLQEFLDGDQRGVGRADGSDAVLAAFEDEAGLQQAVASLIDKGKLAGLLNLWLKGLRVDWQRLYGGAKPNPITAPGYPFSREKQQAVKSGPAPRAFTDRIGVLHPLVHQNTSDFYQQRFSSTFRGDEFFLADHQVQGQRVLPGAAYLEMAAAAFAQASGVDSGATLRLKHINWLRPVIVDNALRVHTGLSLLENGEATYEVYTDNGQERLVHGRGVIGSQDTAQRLASLDLDALRLRMDGGALTAQACYAAFEGFGLQYGSGHRGIAEISRGENEVLARITLPESLRADCDAYLLHPSLLDSALQSIIGLLMDADAVPSKPALPFALDELIVTGKPGSELWAWIRPARGVGAADQVQKYDLDLCDAHGDIQVRMRGFSTRSLEPDTEAAPTDSQLINLCPVWNRIPADQCRAANPAQRVLVLGASQHYGAIREVYPKARFFDPDTGADVDRLAEALESLGHMDHLIWVAPAADQRPEAVIGGQDEGVLQVFRLIKALLSLGYAQHNLSWTLVTRQCLSISDEAVNPAHAGVHGLAGSLAKEYPHWTIRVLDMPADQEPWAQLLSPPDNTDVLVWRRGEWFKQSLAPLNPPAQPHAPYKTRGVYVVIGGAGGIGEAWSRLMIQTYQAKLIWIGRSKPDGAVQAKIDALAALGSAPTYISADATDEASLRAAYDQIKAAFPRIHGVIHSAIVLLDQSLAKMDETRFRAALAAKVDVSVRLSQVFEQEPLDFVLFFSSLQSFLKNPGQSNYAAGCTFKDAFAKHLSRTWTCDVKVMNWGYWGNVGVVSESSYREQMARDGIGSIEPPDGMAALELLLGGSLDQMALVKTLKPNALGMIDHSQQVQIAASHADSVIQKLPATVEAGRAEIIGADREADQAALQGLVTHLLAATLRESGLTGHSQIVPAYHRWLDESLTLIERAEHQSEPLWNQWEDLKTRAQARPDLKAWMTLLEPCLRNLPQILCGEIRATEILFPNSSLDLVEGVYHGNAVADLFNSILADGVTSYLTQRLERDPNAQFRILEIGAGTGGTTAGLLKELTPFKNHLGEYCYTDLSRAFLIHAERAFVPDHAYVTTRIFDVEKPLAPQGFEMARYDLVIATNVLHATRNIRQTLRHAKALLHGNGLLLLNEMTANTPAHHLTFGLLEGWWRYEDSALRMSGCPGLSPQAWDHVLKAEGFDTVLFPAEAAHDLGHQIVVAQSNGCIRLPAWDQAPVQAAEQPEPVTHSTRRASMSLDALHLQCANWLKGLVAETLNLASNRIDASRPLEAYGIDSILVVQLTEVMRKHFDGIGSTLFFEVQTIDALADYLIRTQKDNLIKKLGVEDIPQAAPPAAVLRKPRLNRLPKPAPAAQRTQDVAVIGLSGRYPLAKDPHQFWERLKTGTNCITEIPADRWDWRSWYDDERGKPGYSYSRWGGFIDDVDRFDPLFFHISPRDAELMDPQERLFLEVAYAGIEDAGHTPKSLSNTRRVGVFVGVMNSAYGFNPNYASIANRVSYCLDFQGPSLAVDTACSSSLTAIHLALESLNSATSDCAIAGGVNLILHPGHYLGLSALTMLSSSNQCRSFGDSADGFVDGEAVGAVVLKPLQTAVDDGDHIYGVLKGSMVNAGGKTNGYTVPNPKAQAQLIADALKRADVPAQTISYIEAHGTGTVLGDPIEIVGLTHAFERDGLDLEQAPTAGSCAIGSVKSNIGHTESAAGIAGLTKVLLQMKHGALAPSLHAETLNPNIDFDKTPFAVQQQLAEWKRPLVSIDGKQTQAPRRAGISSFGAGGANAHLIVEEYRAELTDLQAGASAAPQLIVLSARSEERLKRIVQNLHDHIKDPNRFEDRTPVGLKKLAYTLQVGREAMAYRLAWIVSSLADLIECTGQFLAGKPNREHSFQGEVESDTLAAFSNDGELQEAAAKWIERKKYAVLLEFWVKGFAIDWELLHPDGAPQRISLPTYPFLRQRYWKPNRQHDQPAGKPAPKKQWLTFEESWREAPLSDQIDWSAQLQRVSGRLIYLLYGDERRRADFEGLLEQLQQIAELSQPLRLVSVSLDELGAHTFTQTPDVVLILGSEPVGPEQSDLESVFQLSKGLMDLDWAAHIDLFYIYQSPTQPRLDLQALPGFMKSAGLENENHVWHCIGCVGDEDYPVHQLLLTEWLSADSQTPDRWVRYQHTTRQTHQLTELAPSPASAPFRSGATYLLAGGLGPVGYSLCRELATHYQANLVILSRGALDDDKQQQIRELTALGARVHYHAVDIGDKAALAAVLATVRSQVGPLHGVIHLARLVEDQPIVSKQWDSFERVTRAKVQGTAALDELTAQEPLDFFVLFSSLAAFGIRGSSDYGYAAAYQNAYAHHRNDLLEQGRRSGNTVAQCWGPWTVDRYQPKNRDQHMRDAGFDFIDMKADWDAIAASFNQTAVVGLMAVTDAAKVRRRFGLLDGMPTPQQPPSELETCLAQWEQIQRQGGVVSVTTITDQISFEQMKHQDPATIHRIYKLLFPDQNEPQSPPDVSDSIRRVVLQVLKLDQIGEHQTFQDCGMDSIAATQISIQLERELNRAIQPQWFIEFGSIHLLSQFLTAEAPQALS